MHCRRGRAGTVVVVACGRGGRPWRGRRRGRVRARREWCAGVRAACGAVADGRRGGEAGGQADRGRAATRGRYLPGTAALWAMARQCRAKIGGAADPATSPISGSDLRHVTLLPRHHAWRDRGIAIGAAKSVSFLKKPTVLELELLFKKC